jgi:eukaryotic-like serine/threonine-protein kinase
MSRLPLTIGGKYAVTRLIGKGGMGTVYEAFAVDGVRVAVKVLSEELARNETQVARFEREARTVAALDTAHVARVLEAGLDPETKLPFIAMEYLDGEDLREVLRRTYRLPPLVAARVALQACTALQKAHEARVLHRDIKPANLFLACAGSRRTVKLLDFGIAKTASGMRRESETGSLTHTGGMVGSPQYMSPEQARGARHIDERSDIWSLGIVLYQMLCGRTPHAATEEMGSLIVLICTQPPEPIQDRAPWVPKDVAAVVHRCLRMSPAERYASAGELHEALRPLVPKGPEIEETSLVSPTDEEVSRVAERLRAELVRDAPLPMTMDGLSGGSISDSGSESGSGGSARSIAARRRRAVTRVVAGALLVSGSGGLLYALSRPAPPPVHYDAGGAGADAADVTVQVTIAPPDAEVTMGGAPLAVRDGVVELTGPSGSVHKVRVAKGSAAVEVEVVIAGRRALPSRIDLPAPPPASASVSGSAEPAPPAPSAAVPSRPPLFGPRPTATPSATFSAPPLRPSR